MRKLSIISVLALAILFSFAAPTHAGDIVFTTPVYLNGNALYSYNGSAGLCNLAADAAREAGQADIAILSGNTILASLPEGSVSGLELGAVLSSDSSELIETELTSGELRTFLNANLLLGSELFPQISGFHVVALRKLTDEGDFCGDVQNLYMGTVQDNDRDLLQTEPATLKVVTTASLYETYGFARHARSLEMSLYDAMAAYLETLPGENIEAAAAEERIQVMGDTINLPLVLQKLVLHVPTPVVCGLTTPDIIPDSAVFALSGQDRWLSCRFLFNEIPYALSISGMSIETPANVDTSVAVTQELPAGRKTANMFDTNTVFVDLRGNDTIPEGSLLTVDLSSIYEKNTTLYLYYYNENGDILPLIDNVQVARNGRITFPVSSSSTYIINSRDLTSSSALALSPDHPYIPGLVICIAGFGIWLAAFLFSRKAAARNPRK